MNPFSRAMFATARFIAGSGRAEWVNAMAAEADSMDGDSTAWALGCLWASVVDRLARDWWLPAAVVLLPLVMSFWKGMIFFATSDMIAHRRIPDWLAVSSWILSPFPSQPFSPSGGAGGRLMSQSHSASSSQKHFRSCSCGEWDFRRANGSDRT